jgi:plasmid maintenance system antidote protein VapI
LDTTPESWLRMQTAVDLWDVQREPERFKSIIPIKHQTV